MEADWATKFVKFDELIFLVWNIIYFDQLGTFNNEKFICCFRKQTFRFPREQVRWLSYCLDKHGDDFKAMARDPKNVWQETPKQIRQKLLKFISIPEQFNDYASERGLLKDE